MTSRHPLTWAVVSLHAGVLLAWSWLRHQHFGSHAFDLGAYHNVFWHQAFRGVAWNGVEHMHQWSAHLEVGLMVLWAPYRVWASPFWLFALQGLASVGAGLVLDAHVRQVSGKPLLASVAVAAMLCTPQLLFAQIYDFHSIMLCVFPMALVAFGIERDSPWRVVLGAALACSLREQMGLVVAMAGLAWALRHTGRRAWGAGLAVAGLSLFAAEVLWLIPSFGTGEQFRYVSQYQRVGGSPGAALTMALTRPLHFLGLAVEGGRWQYLIKLAAGAVPLVLLSLRSVRRFAWPLLLAAPLLMVQLLSDREAVWSVRFQYGAPVVALISAAAGLAMSSLAPRLAMTLALGWLAVNVGYAGLRWAPYAAFKSGPADFAFEGSPRAKALEEAFALISDDASVSAQDHLVPHLANREQIHQWPDGESVDEYVVLDEAGVPGDLAVEATMAAQAGARRLRESADYERVFDREGVLVLKRRAFSRSSEEKSP